MKPSKRLKSIKNGWKSKGLQKPKKATYDPNAKNGYVKGVTSTGAQKAFTDGKEADVVANPQIIGLKLNMKMLIRKPR